MTNTTFRTNLDAVDQALLNELRENARCPVALLARKVGLSRTAVQARIARLERDKVIAGYGLRSGAAFEQSQVAAHVMLTVGPKLSGPVEAALRKIPEVRTLLSISGTFDMIAIVQAASIEGLDALIDRIGLLDGVERTHTSVVLSRRFER
ncbi:DNA-binding transcriptional regulator, Lrp family [Polaromonas sp. OV174]|uniref:Lrp/AsnC family transcriptional regulator n=1 Tax=Polaromonas sp. OV174 TaxID=1855300 RepID=UPI0008EBE2E3|nr:Lrp/AsnC family transcriptional regulator [Polaromonas sp. OV174]SFC80609.1 DNA-binding transcriptional regulator, Lrp family [Polaromonas sp. OV174]